MSPSFQMQQCVDKQIQDEPARTHAVCKGLFFGFAKTNNNFTVALAKSIGKDVWHVSRAAQLFIQRPRFQRTDEDEGDVPAGKRFFRDRRVGKTRYPRAPR